MDFNDGFLCDRMIWILELQRKAKMLEVFLPNRIYSVYLYSFVCKGEKGILNTYFEEAILIGFGILAIRESHL